jgi:hypothetical protein
MRAHAGATASRHCFAASARNIRSVERETRWRWRLKVLWTAACGQLYTIRQSPKTIIITGGAFSQISIDGTPTGLLAGVFKLGIGETIEVVYSATPMSRVSAE